MPKIIAIIPARSGSKRLKRKNKKLFLDKPLICWTIDLALEIDDLDEIVVSTDDEDILEICMRKYINLNKKFTILKRTKKLASDSTPIWKVIQDIYIKGYLDENSIICLLQPTSPLRLKEDIEIPIYMFLYNNIGVVSIYKKDDLTYKRNGAIYIDSYKNWIKNKTVDGQYYLMPYERSVDIDNEDDWNLAVKLMKERLE